MKRLFALFEVLHCVLEITDRLLLNFVLLLLIANSHLEIHQSIRLIIESPILHIVRNLEGQDLHIEHIDVHLLHFFLL